jgi:hypothetical protein
MLAAAAATAGRERRDGERDGEPPRGYDGHEWSVE